MGSKALNRRKPNAAAEAIAVQRGAAPAEEHSTLQFTDSAVDGWGMAVRGRARVAMPEDAASVERFFAEGAAVEGLGLAPRGAGCSYGDASMNTGGRVMQFTKMNRILDFDAEHGVARVEPGVTIRDLWRCSIRNGYWPAIVPGTMEVTMGGAASMNIHGKNNYVAGSFGEYVQSFSLVTPAEGVLECSREKNADVFHAAISGFGMLGCFTELKLKLKRVHSGRLKVWAIPTPNLAANLECLEELRDEADYLVGWIDFSGRGKHVGRGLMHRGDHYKPGEDPEGIRFFDPAMQESPDRLLKAVPKGWLWPGMWCAHKMGAIPTVNGLKFRAGYHEERKSPYPQTHGAFHFLLDYVPRWQWAFKPGGLTQFQPFLPRPVAHRVISILIGMCHKEGLVPYLGVLKAHKPDPFLMTHAVDGYSLAMDFAVSARPHVRDQLWNLCRRMADVVLDAGGRFYYAKDAVLESSSFPRIHGENAVTQFRALKARLDPQGLLQTDLARRLGVF